MDPVCVGRTAWQLQSAFICMSAKRRRKRMTFDYDHHYPPPPCVVSFQEMESSQSNECEAEFADAFFGADWNSDFYSVSRSQTGAQQGQGNFATASAVDALHETLLMVDQRGESSATPSFPAASSTWAGSTVAGSPARSGVSADRTPPSGGWRPLKQFHANQPKQTDCGAGMVKSSVGEVLGVSQDAGCLEQLLVHCMMAIENNDATLAQQLMWVLNNAVSTRGDPNQRVTAYFLRALISRAARHMTSATHALSSLHVEASDAPLIPRTRVLSAIELAEFVDLTPWHRFGFSASNGAILEALEGRQCVHIVDFSITHCMQWPTLIEAFSKRALGPPCLRLTVHSSRPHVPPLLSMSFEEVGMRLTAFARSKNVPFRFSVLPQKISELAPSCIDVQPGEMLVVNCQMRARYISDEPMEHTSGMQGTSLSARVQFMRWIRAVRPDMVTFVDEDADMGSRDAVSRLKAAFNYLWIPYDTIDTFLPRESMQRMQYERDIGSKIENIIACEAEERVERLETKEKWFHRLTMTSNLRSIHFSDTVVAEVKAMLEEHAAGWGLKTDAGDSLLLTWKGHNAVFAIACVPMIRHPA